MQLFCKTEDSNRTTISSIFAKHIFEIMFFWNCINKVINETKVTSTKVQNKVLQ